MAAKYKFEGGNKGFRVTWADFDLEWIEHLNGELAKAWNKSMGRLGRIVAVGNVRGIWHILENRQDIVRASASEKAMLADMNDAVEIDVARRGVQLPPLPALTAEQRVELILHQRNIKKDLAIENIRSTTQVQMMTIEKEAEQKRLKTQLAEETYRHLMAQPRTAEAAERDAKRINALTLQLDFSKKREANLLQQNTRQKAEIKGLQQQLVEATRAE